MIQRVFVCALFLFIACQLTAQNNILVLQSDFGLKDGAVAAMKGVALNVSRELKIFDLTHEIPPYNIWEAAYRLNQTASYWPAQTVFVSIVDPGVGSSRKSVVVKTRTGPYYFVTPDNGTLTLIAQSLGVVEVREIDETRNRLQGSGDSYTFHGRDVYAYTGARLAAGVITFAEVGKELPKEVQLIPYQKAAAVDGSIKGTIDILDVQYGNLWTNIDKVMLTKLGVRYGDVLHVTIYNKSVKRYEGEIPFAETFSAVKEGLPVSYLNSLLNFSIGINMGSFAGQHQIGSGAEWMITVKKK